ncbi:MAG: hypothetical protein R3F49_14590 [Planctomycetota bacterium]
MLSHLSHQSLATPRRAPVVPIAGAAPRFGRAARLAVGLVCSLALAACRATPTLAPTPDGAREKAQFKALLHDLSRKGGAAGLDTEVLAAQTARFNEVVAWHDAGELKSPAQMFWAGATLVRSDEPAHLLLAEALGASAATLGEHRGRLVQAESRDRMAMLVGEAQPYGTQMVFVPITGEWRLYTVNMATTDEERRALGLPSLAELEARARARNDAPLTARLRDELVRPGSLQD